MKKHFLKCCGVKDTHEKLDSQGSKSSKSHGSSQSSSKSKKDKKDKGDKCGERRKVISHTDWSLNLVVKPLLRSRSWKVCIIVYTLLDPAQKAVITRVTRSRRNMAKSHISPIKSHISRHGSI